MNKLGDNFGQLLLPTEIFLLLSQLGCDVFFFEITTQNQHSCEYSMININNGVYFIGCYWVILNTKLTSQPYRCDCVSIKCKHFNIVSESVHRSMHKIQWIKTSTRAHIAHFRFDSCWCCCCRRRRLHASALEHRQEFRVCVFFFFAFYGK